MVSAQLYKYLRYSISFFIFEDKQTKINVIIMWFEFFLIFNIM